MIYDKVVLLLNGESGVGKTTIAKKLCEHPNYNLIKSYTTRDPRPYEEYDHHFISKPEAVKMLQGCNVVASTVYGGHPYFTLSNQFIDNMINVYIVDDLGVCNSINYIKRWVDTGYATVRIKSERECNRKDRDYSFLGDEYFMLDVDNDGNVDDVVKKISDWIDMVI